MNSEITQNSFKLSLNQDPRNSFNGNSVDTKAKRPFCNAFAGCGRKRSNEIAPANPGFDESEDGISDLLELNSEPAIENLMRQIMSEAKMYEAIQEANRELFLQKLKHSRSPSQTIYSVQ